MKQKNTLTHTVQPVHERKDTSNKPRCAHVTTPMRVARRQTSRRLRALAGGASKSAEQLSSPTDAACSLPLRETTAVLCFFLLFVRSAVLEEGTWVVLFF